MQPASRRDVLKQSLMLSAAAAALPASGLSAAPAETDKPRLGTNNVILFQGDSITDAGRDRRRGEPNDARALGRGYPLMLAGAFLADYPELDLKVYNRGISGNKVPDLDARWEPDCVELKPDVLSILIGINDLWHKLNGRYDGTVESYQSGYRALLERTSKALPKTRIVICEPFVLRTGAVNDKWFPEFEQRRAVAEKLAGEFKLAYVPFQSMFDDAVKSAPPSYWAGDGVHPTVAGHALMAKTWRDVVGL
ncbi:SGNH/GDSL hydrolase family protein [Roseimaritima ulvae]|nr:SGNH/GDSL hydrolase family protein [Roseimaritima ulvae]